MARIRDEDIALVRERARIDEVVREYVALKGAGGGSLKGLCPFHEERTPSFHVTPSKGFWYCFGCSEGGDVVDFLRKIDHLTFAEAIEKLAGRTGVTLRYEEGGAAPGRQQGQRTRLVEAHKIAAAFYVESLTRPDAAAGREFLAARGFDEAAAATFGVGFAPKGWDSLVSHLRGRGFSQEEMLAAGLVSQGNRGVYDRFRGRLVWPIRDLSGDTIGFGARKLFDDDDGPKYLNTPETAIYKKSQVLYGIDLSRKAIAQQQRAVIVEGYTDVMACHLAGVSTAVATCGTAFGTDHIKVLRRLLMDDDVFAGQVVFTFDGDAAGRKAALRAFDDDQRFTAATFVAVEPHGLDPCDLRLEHGDEAVRSLVERPVPMFAFAIRAQLAAHDLDTAEGRVAALHDAAPVVARIRDTALRPEYTRLLAGWLGMELAPVSQAVARASRTAPPAAGPSSPGGGPSARSSASAPVAPSGAAPAAPEQRPDPRNLAHHVEREALKAAMQQPVAVAAWFDTVEPSAFTFPPYVTVHGAILAAGGATAGAAMAPQPWADAVLAACPDDRVRGLVTSLVVEPLRTEEGEVETRYAVGIVARLLEFDAARRIRELKGRLQRLDAEGSVPDPEASAAVFRDLLALEQYRRELHERAVGDG